ncbi:MAG: DUF4445 domain-containing protein [Verrucomicrobiae bacterium]|nr:DUF4445 domain-containing protein [Verrucomicrobiae bacterium]
MSRPSKVRIRLQPMGKELEVAKGSSLQDLLFAHGVEFPCGGRARCKGCRVRVIEGDLPLTPEQERLLTKEECDAGWRLSCQGRAEGDLTLELAQWEARILADDRAFSFVPREGLGVAVDLGTTTLAAQLLDLKTANVLAVRTGLNPQARHGADIMSRVSFAMTENGQARLEALIRKEVGKLVRDLLKAAAADAAAVRDVAIVGNTVMHHLFCGVNIEPLSHYPFEAVDDGLKIFPAKDLGWDLPNARALFLPCLGGFVGSDILAGILSTPLRDSADLVALVDLGTNGEMAVGNRERMLCASTAAGPAFEGARISQGMRAATGAISSASVKDGRLECHVLGEGKARGLCGSGLVDVVACALDLGKILPSGRFADGAKELPLLPSVRLTQTDVRELQLAKGAIAAGVRILLQQWGATPGDLKALYLAGAFGNYINRASARRIGLIPYPREVVHSSGNTALLGAKMALFLSENEEGVYADLRARVRHVGLNEDPAFQEIYVEEMGFPS